MGDCRLWFDRGMDPIKVDPGILRGTPCFSGTRVPVKNLFDYLEGGETLDEFLRQFPSVTREQALALLKLAREVVTASPVAARSWHAH